MNPDEQKFSDLLHGLALGEMESENATLRQQVLDLTGEVERLRDGIVIARSLIPAFGICEEGLDVLRQLLKEKTS